MSFVQWLLWAFVLILQNFAFTFVSRARNSGSLSRHMIAGFFSNGVWFVSQILIFSQLMKIMTGQYGIPAAIGTSLYYTAFTLAGSLLAHKFSLATEKGKSAVGANKKFAQISTEEWQFVRDYFQSIKGMEESGRNLAGFTPEALALIEQLPRISTLAEQAYAMSCDGMPVAVTAAKVDGATIIS